MDAVLPDGATEALQFHHMTQAQFLERKGQIMEIMRRSSPNGSPSADRDGA